MRKSKRMLRKFLLLTSSALLLVSLTVGVTLAYLTDTDEVDNTFTVGNVAITLDEAPIGADGDPLPVIALRRTNIICCTATSTTRILLSTWMRSRKMAGCL